ncbi:hypothetical protein FA15DRAFT_663104 [Coprinopsis marcescibilis]|uniref:Uncharacterized protein n=1 Tax=Coprinopsis marcescibilis TaxID=230819 RepID=A0A5C3L9W5_COPMA|nr:hypothetical protein FA15DRAFT_663104 [Coprinopsis marcescibilis]
MASSESSSTLHSTIENTPQYPPVFLRCRSIAFGLICFLSFLWAILLCVVAFLQWQILDQPQQSFLLVMLTIHTLTIIVLMFLLVKNFRAWLDGARCLLALIVHIGVASAFAYSSPTFRCSQSDKLCSARVFTILATSWLIPVLLIVYAICLSVVSYRLRRLEKTQEKETDDLEKRSTLTLEDDDLKKWNQPSPNPSSFFAAPLTPGTPKSEYPPRQSIQTILPTSNSNPTYPWTPDVTNNVVNSHSSESEGLPQQSIMPTLPMNSSYPLAASSPPVTQPYPFHYPSRRPTLSTAPLNPQFTHVPTPTQNDYSPRSVPRQSMSTMSFLPATPNSTRSPYLPRQSTLNMAGMHPGLPPTPSSTRSQYLARQSTMRMHPGVPSLPPTPGGVQRYHSFQPSVLVMPPPAQALVRSPQNGVARGQFPHPGLIRQSAPPKHRPPPVNTNIPQASIATVEQQRRSMHYSALFQQGPRTPITAQMNPIRGIPAEPVPPLPSPWRQPSSKHDSNSSTSSWSLYGTGTEESSSPRTPTRLSKPSRASKLL